MEWITQILFSHYLFSMTDWHLCPSSLESQAFHLTALNEGLDVFSGRIGVFVGCNLSFEPTNQSAGGVAMGVAPRVVTSGFEQSSSPKKFPEETKHSLWIILERLNLAT